MAADGSPLRPAGYALQFTVLAGRPAASSSPGRSRSPRSTPWSCARPPTSTTRAYGGLGADFDRDGWLDLAIVNEDSGDLRVFKNRADGNGLYDPFLQPPDADRARGQPQRAGRLRQRRPPRRRHRRTCRTTRSPSSSADGDGTFEPQQVVAVGGAPHGLVVLDADGDGDPDIATANTGGNNVSLLLNDGNGVFGPATSFDSGRQRRVLAGRRRHEQRRHRRPGGGHPQRPDDPRAARQRERHVHPRRQPRRRGAPPGSSPSGDVDGDGNLDVATGNGGSGNGAILKGNGDGTLGRGGGGHGPAARSWPATSGTSTATATWTGCCPPSAARAGSSTRTTAPAS